MAQQEVAAGGHKQQVVAHGEGDGMAAAPAAVRSVRHFATCDSQTACQATNHQAAKQPCKRDCRLCPPADVFGAVVQAKQVAVAAAAARAADGAGQVSQARLFPRLGQLAVPVV